MERKKERKGESGEDVGREREKKGPKGKGDIQKDAAGVDR